MHPKFDPTRVQTHDFQITDSTFHVPETLVLSTEPSATSFKERSVLPLALCPGKHALSAFCFDAILIHLMIDFLCIISTLRCDFWYCDHEETC